MLYLLAGGAIALTSCALILFLFTDDILNGYLRPKLTNLVQKACGGACSVHVGQIKLLPSGALEIVDIRFAADTTAGRAQGASPLLASLSRIDADTLRISGVSWYSLLTNGGFYASRVEVCSPRIDLRRQETTTGDGSLPGDLPVVSIEEMTVRDGEILDQPSRLASSGNSLKGVSLKLRGFHLDRATFRTQAPALFSRDGEFVVATLTHHSPDGLYACSARSIRGSYGDSILTIDSLAVRPTLDEEDFARRRKVSNLRFDLFFRRLALAGADLSRLLDGSAVLLRSVLAEDWTADIYRDKRMYMDPTPSRRLLPHEIFQRLKIPVRIDSVFLRKGSISYRDRWPTDTEPGVITFERLSGSILRITNAGSPVQPPTVFEGTVYIMGEGRLDFAIEYPLLSPTFTMRYRGTLHEMKIASLNRNLVHTKRVRIRGGVLDRASVDVNIRDGTANGALQLAYHDLNMEVLPKTSWKKKGLREKFGTFVINTFKFKSHNPEKGLPLHSVQLQNRWMGDVSFLNFLWITVRRGIGSVIGFS